MGGLTIFQYEKLSLVASPAPLFPRAHHHQPECFYKTLWQLAREIQFSKVVHTWWVTTVILASQEAEIRKITV
jgi:hypothetical protein